MKHGWKITGVWLALMTVTVAAETGRPPPTAPTPKAKKFCDPVCELRSQDAAFSLLVETFRQHQSYNVEIDYRYRLQAIAEKQGEQSQFLIKSDSEALKELRRLLIDLAKTRARPADEQTGNAGRKLSSRL